jgi:hypothetical protein
MHAPPDLKSERAALAGSPVSQKSLPCTADITETARDLQARSPLRLQTFLLVRRLAISAPMAEALAPIIYGSWRS